MILKTGARNLHINERTHIMGILNVTPDSFSDGGFYQQRDKAVDRAAVMIAEGVDILDVGGESTRPGATHISAEQELARVVPIIEAISERFEIPISIDTYKAQVAEEALKSGAHIINDVWGGKADPEMAQVAARYQVPIILMHNRPNKDYRQLMPDILSDLQESISLCEQAGVAKDHIILDPGIGFAKTYEHNIECMRQLNQLVSLGYPVVLGTSRKSFIGLTLDLPADQRVEGTIATTCYGIMQGCQLIRVHDVQANKRAAKMIDAFMGKGAATHG
jgi:dihydropteroate synthase